MIIKSIITSLLLSICCNGFHTTEVQKEDTLTDAQVDGFYQNGRWIGPGWWANRLQDWSANGESKTEILCSPNKPFLGWRMAHDMTRDIDLSQGNLDLSITLQMKAKGEGNRKIAPNSMAGLIIGTGHNLTDPMARAMIFELHAKKRKKIPAVPGTGIAVVISGDGFLNIIDLDNGKNLIRTKLPDVQTKIHHTAFKITIYCKLANYTIIE